MRPSGLRIFSILAGEAVQDAMRRRIVPAIAVAALFSLLAVDSCSSCAGGTVVQNGQQVPTEAVAGWSGMIIFTVLSLWVMVLGGLLASDHLAETLSDGSAALVLARPVRRSEFALARLAGALGIAYVTGAIVLTITGVLLNARADVSGGAAVWAGLACAGGAFIVSTLSMALSLSLTRTATALAVLVLVGGVALSESFLLFGAEMGGLGFVLQRFAPPLCTAVVLALSPWIEPVTPNVDPVIVGLRMVFWMVASVLILLARFRREELSS